VELALGVCLCELKVVLIYNLDLSYVMYSRVRVGSFTYIKGKIQYQWQLGKESVPSHI
jgi:hypothetical protein